MSADIVGSHLQNQRAAVKMLHDRIVVLVQYLSDVMAGQWSSFASSIECLVSSPQLITRNRAGKERPCGSPRLSGACGVLAC
jgi:hypothetical protein